MFGVKLKVTYCRYDGNQLMAYGDIGMETCSPDITLPDNYDAYGVLDGSVQFSYDACGNMTANTNKGIVKMTYNLLNQPASIFFRDGTVIRYDYSADGERLRARYGHVKYNVAIPEAGIMTATFQPTDTTGYSMTSSDIYDGRYIYHTYPYYATYKTYKTSLSRIRIDGGIVTDFSAGNPSLLFELADHQGNIRYVADAKGAMETLYQYYPFGGYFVNGMKYVHPYLYGGKEIEESNGLDEYDFEARNYDPALCRFNTMDPLSEKYYSISPYAYCGDNPIRYVDPDGKKIESDLQSQKNICNTLTMDESQYVRFDKNGNLNTRLLNTSMSESANMKALKSLANSDIIYSFHVEEKDHNGKAFFDKSEDNANFYRGVTELPNSKNNPSPDRKVHIIVGDVLDEKQQVKTTAHEGYGHAYFYEIYRNTDKASHTYKTEGRMTWDDEIKMNVFEVIKVPTNISLENQINTVVNQAETNYDKRH